MPNIQTYENTDNGLQPSGLGASSLEQEARINRIDLDQAAQATKGTFQEFGRDVAQVGPIADNVYQQAVVVPDISKLSASKAIGLDQMTQQYNTLMSNPNNLNDPTVGQKFINDTLNPFLDKYQSSANTTEGHQFAQAQADDIRNHFSDKIAADMSIRAGQAAVFNHQTSTDALSNYVYNDPTAMDMALGTAEASTTAVVAARNLDPATASKMQTDLMQDDRNSIIMSGLHGMAVANPNGAQWQLASGSLNKYLEQIPANLQDAARTMINAQVKVAAEADKADQLQQDKQDVRNFNANATDLLASGVQSDGTIRFSPDALKSVFAQGGLAFMRGPQRGLVAPADIKAIYTGMMEANKQAAEGVPVISDGTTYENFLRRSTLPPDSPDALSQADLWGAVATHHLSPHDAEAFGKIITGQDKDAAVDNQSLTPFFTTMKSMITGSNANSPAPAYATDQRWYQFQVDTRMRIQQGHQAGLTTAEMLNPSSTHYLYKNPALLKAYMFTTADQATVSALPDNDSNGTAQLAPAPRTDINDVSPNDQLNPSGTSAADAAANTSAFYSGMTVAPLQRMPNETPAQYLARTSQ